MSAGKEAGEGAPGRMRRTAETKRDPSLENVISFLHSTGSKLHIHLLVIWPKEKLF